MSTLRVVFPKPGFFLTDVRVSLTLDGAAIYDGGFLAGIDVSVDTSPGPHRIESIINIGIAKRRRAWDVDVPAGGCDVAIEYSRVWGNFTKRPRVAARG
jgi:hypothetical protein